MRTRRHWHQVFRTLTPPLSALLAGVALLAAACGGAEDSEVLGTPPLASGGSAGAAGAGKGSPYGGPDGAGPSKGGHDGSGWGNGWGSDGAPPSYGKGGAGNWGGVGGTAGTGNKGGSSGGSWGSDGSGIAGTGNKGGSWGSDGSGIAGSWGSDGAPPYGGWGGSWGSDGSGIAGSWGSDGSGIAGSWGSDGSGIAGSWGSDGSGIAGSWGSDGSGIAGSWGSDGSGIAGSGTGGSDGAGAGGDGGVGGSAGSSVSAGGSAGSMTAAGGSAGGEPCVPSAEVCNGKDDDCDGQIDEEGAAGCTMFLADKDGDGFGVEGDARCLCQPEAPYSASQPGDCDDARPSVHPSAPELCDALDNDCNGFVDEGDGVCGCAVVTSGGHAYQFCSTHRSWADAEAACQAHGYHLVTVESGAEQDFVSSVAGLFSYEKFWIGLNDRAQEGSFAWSSGLSSGFTAWAPGEPANATGDEDCTEIDGSLPSENWKSATCDAPLAYVCRSN